ncbi:hypothetical protein ACFQY7_07005 [Actinomadura luteofluorescens]|uniref:hypothetical protein n=1 Tax=Actinomadura luteofluorescens TaxID=46163 RepID=UPI003644BCE2
MGTDLRRHEELRGCSGPLTVSLPARLDRSLDLAVSAAASEAADQIEAGDAHAEWYSWERCVPPAAPGRPSWFPIGFDFDAEHWPAGQASAAPAETYGHHDRFVVRLSCQATGDGMRFTLGYDGDALADPAAGQLMESFLAVVTDSLARPDSACRDLDLLGERGGGCCCDRAGTGRAARPARALGRWWRSRPRGGPRTWRWCAARTG